MQILQQITLHMLSLFLWMKLLSGAKCQRELNTTWKRKARANLVSKWKYEFYQTF